MARIKIVTDSTSDILPEQASKYGIEVIPLNVHFGDEVFKDGVDITPGQFYAKLQNSGFPPRTAQPSEKKSPAPSSSVSPWTHCTLA